MSRFEIVKNDDVNFIIESLKGGMHRTLDGGMVKIGTPECRADILRRIDDMGHNRNDQLHGSDSRAYCTGMLRVLRRKLKENDKVAAQQQEDTLEETAGNNDKTTKSICEDAANRMMKLAGLID